MNKVLICVPTYNRNESLLDCLKSLKNIENNNYFKVNILVLDNSLKNNSFKIVNKFKIKHNLKIFQYHEKKRGIVYARNKCLKISKKLKPNYIAFIDDDCLVNKYWLKNIHKLLNKINPDVITGPQKHSDISKYSFLFEKNYKKDLVKVKWAASNNVFFKFDILKNKSIKNFDKNLNKFGMGEDQLFFSEINKLGYKIYWSKKIFVTEKVHQHRSDISWIKERSKRLGILGHYLDIKIYGTLRGYLINYLKSLFLLLLSIFCYFNIFNRNKNLHFQNNINRFYGKIIGPFRIKKIKFLK